MGYQKYAKVRGANKEVLDWISKNLANYLKKNKENKTEIKHIIDYLTSDDAPSRLARMSYNEVKKNTEKWDNKLQELGMNIVEEEEDTKLIKDFGDGFKIVKLVNKNSYEREGFLMRHCAASFYDSDTEVYSLRDAKNIPHVMMEKDQQIKGKGTGLVNPKYIGYIISFLEEVGMVVDDSKMKNIGYVNVENLKDEFSFGELFGGKYFFKDDIDKVPAKDDIRLFNIFGLVKVDGGFNASFRFDVMKSVENFFGKVSKKACNSSTLAAGDSSTLAACDASTLAAGDSSTLVAFNTSTLAAGDSSTLVTLNSSTLGAYNWSTLVAHDRSALVARNSSTLAAHNSSTLAALNSSTLVARDSSTLAAGRLSTLIARDSSTLAALSSSTLVANDFSTLAAGSLTTLIARDSSTLAAGDLSTLTVGKNSTMMAGSKSKARGKHGSVIFLYERNDDGDIVDYACGVVGKDIEEDTFYVLKNGALVKEHDEDEE